MIPKSKATSYPTLAPVIMAFRNSQLRTASSKNRGGNSAVIEVRASSNRRSLEALYLEVGELAKKHGLKIEYQVIKTKPKDLPAARTPKSSRLNRR